MNLGVIYIHVVWRPMSLLESGLKKTWKSSVANQHLAKCVQGMPETYWMFQESNQHTNWMR